MNVELMKEVKRRVLAEPKSVDMDDFCKTSGVKEGYCGSVGCISGHAILAVGIKPKVLYGFDMDAHALGRTLLDISNREANQLFYFHNDVDSVANGDECEEDCPYYKFSVRLKKQRAGSVRYAKIVADAIDHAIERDQTGEIFYD